MLINMTLTEAHAAMIQEALLSHMMRLDDARDKLAKTFPLPANGYAYEAAAAKLEACRDLYRQLQTVIDIDVHQDFSDLPF